MCLGSGGAGAVQLAGHELQYADMEEDMAATLILLVACARS
jgi:hypothetical protein